MNRHKLENIFNEQENLGIKMNLLCDNIGISRSFLYDFRKRGGGISVNALEKIAKYFKIPISYFFDEEQSIESEKISSVEYEKLLDENIYLKSEINKHIHCQEIIEQKNIIIEQQKTIIDQLIKK